MKGDVRLTRQELSARLAASSRGKVTSRFKEVFMRIVRYSLLALLVVAAFTGCKKGGGGGYMRTAPSPAVTK
jgi:hypothetical protein